MSRNSVRVCDPCPVCNDPSRFVTLVDTLYDEFLCAGGFMPGLLGHVTVRKHSLEALLSSVVTQPIKVLDRYPHQCTKCGEPAYIGLSEIDHKDSARNKVCR